MFFLVKTTEGIFWEWDLRSECTLQIFPFPLYESG